jgi:hypothetical protein
MRANAINNLYLSVRRNFSGTEFREFSAELFAAAAGMQALRRCTSRAQSGWVARNSPFCFAIWRLERALPNVCMFADLD